MWKSKRKLPDLVDYPGSRDRPWNEIPLGVSASGEVVWDVQDAPTLRVVGTSGSGTGTLMRDVLIHCSLHSDDWEVWGVDVLLMTLLQYKKTYSLLKEFAYKINEGSKLCQSLCDEMEDRYQQMKAAGVRHFRDLPEPPKAILLTIHEAGIFLDRAEYNPKPGKYDPAVAESWDGELAAKNEARKALFHLAREGRAAGIYVFMTIDQHTRHEVPDFQQSSGLVVLGRGVTTSTVRTLLWQDDIAYDLSPKAVPGRGVFKTHKGEDGTLFQTYFSEASKWLYKANDYNQR